MEPQMIESLQDNLAEYLMELQAELERQIDGRSPQNELFFDYSDWLSNKF
jgi:hypothetical protein